MTRPLIYYSIAIFLGSIVSVCFMNKFFILGAVLAALFLILFMHLTFKEVFIIILFAIFSMVNTYIYFNKFNAYLFKENIRVEGKLGLDTLGVYKGKKIIIDNIDFESYKNGLINVSGYIEKSPKYEFGIIGRLHVAENHSFKKDYIYKINLLKEQIYNRLVSSIGEENAALTSGICFGEVSNIKKEQKNLFRDLGISHIISVSGLHIAMIYKIIENIFSYKISIIITVLYTILTGAKAPTLRALFMIILLKCSSKIYKKYDNMSSLAFSAIVLLIIKPYLSLDMGFHLSYLATLGILLFYKKIKRTLYKLPSFIKDPLAITLSAQIFSLPYSVFAFKSINLNFILSNLILIPFYTAILILGNLYFILSNIAVINSTIIFLLKICFSALQGGYILFNNIGFSTSYLSYLDGIIILALYLSYGLYKKGYKRIKLFPLTLLLLAVIQYYCFIPTIEYFKYGKDVFALFKYRNSNVLIANNSIKREEILNTLKVQKKLVLGEEDINLILKNNTFVTLQKDIESFNVHINTKKKKNIIVSKDKNKDLPLITYKESDIIRIDANTEEYSFNVENLKTIYIFNDSVYVIDNFP